MKRFNVNYSVAIGGLVMSRAQLLDCMSSKLKCRAQY